MGDLFLKHLVKFSKDFISRLLHPICFKWNNLKCVAYVDTNFTDLDSKINVFLHQKINFVYKKSNSS